MPNIVIMITAAFAAGIWCADLYRLDVIALLFVAALFIGAALLQIRCGSRYLAVTVLGLFFIAGIIRYNHAIIVSIADISHYAGKTATVCGSITEVPQCREFDEKTVILKYVVEANVVSITGVPPEPVGGKLILAVRQPRANMYAEYGDFVVASGNISLLHSYQNPGQINYVDSYKLQGITGRMSVDKFFFRAPENSSLMSMLTKWKSRLSAVINDSMAPSDAAVLQGMLFGGSSGIKQEVVKNFAATGLFHILSVSGTHIALIGAIATWFAAWLGLRRFSALPVAGCIILYALCAGLSPPVIRSLVMGIAALAAIGLGRQKDSLQALALAALVMLIYQPGLIYDISFQLSFGATAGLVLFYEKTLRLLSFLPPMIAGATAVTITAQLGILPFLAWYFSTFPLISFIANLLILPPLEFVIIIGLIGSITGVFVPLIGKVLLVFCALIIGAANDLAAVLAALPGSSIHLPPCGVVAGFVYYVSLFWIYGYLSPYIPGVDEVWQRWKSKCAYLLVLIAVSGLIYIYCPQPLQVHFIDVGQGDAVLVKTPHGKAVLIDSGGTGQSEFDIGDRVVAPYLRHYNVASLDYIFLTHGHMDHAGGAAGVAAEIPVKNIIVADEAPSVSVRALKRVAKDAVFITGNKGQTIVLDGVSFSIVHDAAGSIAKSGNEVCNVIRINYGNHSFLITGDIGGQEEHSMVSGGYITPGTVLKVAHHGASTSTTSEFLSVYSPEYAVISVGYNNQFGHPAPDALKRLRDHKIKVFRTDMDGAVIFSSDGKKMSIETWVKPSEHGKL